MHYCKVEIAKKNYTLFWGKLCQLKLCFCNNNVILNVWLYLVPNSTKRSVHYFCGVVLLDYLHKGPSGINLVSLLFWHQRESDRYCSTVHCWATTFQSSPKKILFYLLKFLGPQFSPSALEEPHIHISTMISEKKCFFYIQLCNYKNQTFNADMLHLPF